ncbi:hypothetical protein PIB30_093146, partial [Stylosanthes scabra]|nr:hypothetical protein [Stylosanthes scabra]
MWNGCDEGGGLMVFIVGFGGVRDGLGQGGSWEATGHVGPSTRRYGSIMADKPGPTGSPRHHNIVQDEDEALLLRHGRTTRPFSFQRFVGLRKRPLPAVPSGL